MKEEIIKLCNEIKNNNNCSGCGGSFNNHTCIYCGNDSQVLKRLIDELGLVLVKLSGCDDEILNALYSIRGMKIGAVDSLLDQYDYDNVLKKRYSDIFNRALNDSLDKDDCHSIIYFLDNNLFFGENRDKFINTLMKRLLMGELDVSINEILILIKHFVEMCMSLKVKNPKCVFEELDEDVLGDAFWSRIRLDKNKIIALIQSENFFQVLELIFHECTHTYQKYLVHIEKEISYNALKQVKEELIRGQVEGYYDENYLKYSSEVDARYCGVSFTKQYLETLGLEADYNSYFNGALNREMALLTDETRTVNGVQTTIDEAFSMFVVDVSVLALFPVLKVQYKNNNGRIEPKSREEMLSDYEKYKNGELYSNGNPIYIEQLYAYLLGRVVSRSSSFK